MTSVSRSSYGSFHSNIDIDSPSVTKARNRRKWKIVIMLSIVLLFIVLGCSLYTSLFDNHPKYLGYLKKGEKHVKKLRMETQDNSTINTLTLGCEATIILIRHCEKDEDPFIKKFSHEDKHHCNYIGFQRAQFISTLFGSRWPDPSYIIAASASKDRNNQNYREIETVVPLATRTNLTIDTSFGYKETKSLSKHLLSLVGSGSLCGELVLVSWDHHAIPKLGAYLGCGPKEGCSETYPDDSYDQAWVLTYAYEDESLLEPYFYEEENQRMTKKKKKAAQNTTPKKKKAQWRVYGTIENEGFDPLLLFKDKENEKGSELN